MDNTQIIKSAIFGVAIGDALGVPVEFTSRAERKADPVTGMRSYGTHNQPAGTWSDDSSMMFATMDSMIESDDIDYDDMMKRFSKWRYEGDYTPWRVLFDIGVTCNKAIAQYRLGCNPLKCGGIGDRDNGNGSLMRIMPASLYISFVPFIRTESPEKGMWIVSSISSLTHAHLRSRLGCVIHALICREMIIEKESNKRSLNDILISAWERIKNYIELRKDPDCSWELRNYAFVGDPEGLRLTPEEEIRSGGYIIDTFKAALWSLVTTSSFSECVLKAVNLGDDTDTVGAVAGGLAGLWYGFESIPKEWIDVLARKGWIEDLCERFEAINRFNEQIEKKPTLLRVRYIGETDISLISGKVYNVISIEKSWYRIVDETEEDYLFSPEEFEVVSQEE